VARAGRLVAMALGLGALVGCGSGGDSIPQVPALAATQDMFAEGVLHYAELTVAPEELARLVPESDERVRCTLVYDGVQVEEVGVRLRGGQGSRRPVGSKPGFSFKTNEFVKGRSLHGVKRFSLNNSVQDASLLSELMACEIWRRAGVPVRRVAHARVSLNGTYLGVYVVAETYQDGFLGRTFADGSGNLYEGVPGSDLTDVDALELQTNEDENDRSHLHALAAVVATASDDDLAGELEGLLDLDEFLRYWAVEALLDHWDSYAAQNVEPFLAAGPNNYYAYHDPSTGLVSLLPWGADQCFWRVGSDVLSPPHELSVLAGRCFAAPALHARYVEHLRAALAAWDTVDLDRVAREAYERIAGSVAEGDRAGLTFGAFLTAVDRVRAFLRDRPEVVLAQLGG
jgi:spore coat protein CotH